MNTDDRSIWDQLKDDDIRWVTEVLSLWDRLDRKEAVLKSALERPQDRGSALRLLLLLNDHELTTRLFSTLMDLVSVGHADVGLCRTVIKTMNRDWLLTHLEPEAATLLARAGDEEYRRIAELYAEIDAALLEKHVQRALASPNPDIREVGQDFQVCSVR